MYNKEIYRFLRKLLILSLPLGFVIVCYLLMDPFKVIWHYDSYYENHIAHVGMNMDYVSTENFINKNPAQNYNAFIFGNSRSQYWQTEDWQRHIGNDARCYHYYGNGETLFGMMKNIKFVHSCGNSIDYAIFVVDATLLSQTEAKHGHLFCTPPKVVHYRNFINFHATNFFAFLHPIFVLSYTDFRLNKTLRPYMLERYLFEQPVVYNAETNEVVDSMFNKAIADGTFYTVKRMLRFQNMQHPDSISSPVLHDENIEMLHEIAHILSMHHTRYKVVISPLYDQIKFNPEDLQTLQDIFGRDNVYDFSGKSDITSDYHNYYEESHYRPEVARKLMEEIKW